MVTHGCSVNTWCAKDRGPQVRHGCELKTASGTYCGTIRAIEGTVPEKRNALTSESGASSSRGQLKSLDSVAM